MKIGSISSHAPYSAKSYSPQNVVCLNNGSHLGFLYRKEFLEELKKDIKFKGG